MGRLACSHSRGFRVGSVRRWTRALACFYNTNRSLNGKLGVFPAKENEGLPRLKVSLQARRCVPPITILRTARARGRTTVGIVSIVSHIWISLPSFDRERAMSRADIGDIVTNHQRSPGKFLTPRLTDMNDDPLVLIADLRRKAGTHKDICIKSHMHTLAHI
ncbi:uncharacterized protein LOC112466056 isoform X2 [Temnothorax curvispinosus]|uniref:Uncharacterized protein LOC112466056 isoform X2 n=1 Tax=Temnothorax curvispinosus TaxID=300111 RepID=A0A6J1R682_9HYME|nr:uncharacterized protein LOC112466056 isoform X2 [Temnothorax curvispinosus]